LDAIKIHRTESLYDPIKLFVDLHNIKTDILNSL